MNFYLQVSAEHMQVIWDHLYEGKAKDTFPVLEGLKAQIVQQEQAQIDSAKGQAKADLKAELAAETALASSALPSIDGGAGGQG